MPNLFPTASLQHPASEYAGAVVGAVEAGSTPGAEAPLPASTNTAHEAVEVVLHAVDQFATRAQKSVNLRFSVGDAALAVRVELHAGEVRTTFRTDSTELRAALAHEWQSVTQGGVGSERPFRIAPAVFSPADSSSSNAFMGDASAQSREQKAARDTASPMAAFAARARAATPMPASPVAAPPSRVAALTSRHLHTVA